MLCDATVKVIAALSQRVPLTSSVAMVEALAYRRAMEFAKEIVAQDCIDTNLLAMSFFFFGNNKRNSARFGGH